MRDGLLQEGSRSDSLRVNALEVVTGDTVPCRRAADTSAVQLLAQGEAVERLHDDIRNEQVHAAERGNGLESASSPEVAARTS